MCPESALILCSFGMGYALLAVKRPSSLQPRLSRLMRFGWTLKLASKLFTPATRGWDMLGCYFSMSGTHDANADFHMSSASRAFWANKSLFCDKRVPTTLRIKYVETNVTPVACLRAGHRKMYHHHLRQFDCEWRRLLRILLAPPPGVDWSFFSTDLFASANDSRPAPLLRASRPFACSRPPRRGKRLGTMSLMALASANFLKSADTKRSEEKSIVSTVCCPQSLQTREGPPNKEE